MLALYQLIFKMPPIGGYVHQMASFIIILLQKMQNGLRIIPEIATVFPEILSLLFLLIPKNKYGYFPGVREYGYWIVLRVDAGGYCMVLFRGTDKQNGCLLRMPGQMQQEIFGWQMKMKELFYMKAKQVLSLIHISEPTRRTPIS